MVVLENIFLKFSSIFCYNFVKKIVKMLIFYIKIIDIVLLRTIFRGIGAYSLECLFIVQFGVFWSTYCAIWCILEYIFQELSLKKYI